MTLHVPALALPPAPSINFPCPLFDLQPRQIQSDDFNLEDFWKDEEVLLLAPFSSDPLLDRLQTVSQTFFG